MDLKNIKVRERLMGKHQHNKHENKQNNNEKFKCKDKIEISKEALEKDAKVNISVGDSNISFEQKCDDDASKENNDKTSAKSTVNINIEDNKEIEKELEKWKADYLRKAADFENYRKRMIKEKKDAIDYANEVLLEDLVHVLDDFDRAIEAVEKYGGETIKPYMEGFNIIRKQFYSMLENKYSLKYYKSEGELFDPNIHDAKGSRESNEVSEEIVEKELLKGYKLKDRVIRVAQVETVKPKKKT